MDTKWTSMIAFNAVTYLIMSIFFVCIMLSYFLWPCAYIGSVGLVCSYIVNFFAILDTKNSRYSADGEACAAVIKNAAKFDDEVVDYGLRLNALFISQLLLFCHMGFCVGCLSAVSAKSWSLKGKKYL